MTNPKTSPVAESVVEQVARAICNANQADDSDWGVYLDDARAAIAAMPRPIEDDTPTLCDGPEKAATGEATDPLDILRLTLQYAEKSLPGLRIPTLVGGIEAAIRALVKINAGQDDTSTDAGEGVGQKKLRNAVLDRPFANTAPIDWSDHDWHDIAAALRAPTDTGLVGELVEARAEIDRLRGLLINPGDPAWEDARAVLVAELRKLVLDRAADAVAQSEPAMIPSWLALNLIAHAAKAKDQAHG